MTGPDLVIEPRDDTAGTWRGMRLLMELGRCAPDVVRDRNALTTWMAKVVDQTGMTPVSRPLAKHFGSDELAGETVIQVTDRGNVDVHGFDVDRSATLCAVTFEEECDAAAVFELTTEFFAADTARARVVHSYLPAAGSAELVDEHRDDTAGVWRGMRLLMDLADCDPAVVGSSHALDAWAQDLADRIDMVTFGEPLKRQTDDAKILIQMIETSNIDAWGFKNNSAGLCLFSCKEFSPSDALKFTREFFGAGAYRARVIHSYIPS